MSPFSFRYGIDLTFNYGFEKSVNSTDFCCEMYELKDKISQTEIMKLLAHHLQFHLIIRARAYE